MRFEHGWNTTDRPIAYDYGINMAFATRADLDAYGPHPDHQEVVALDARSPTGSSATMKLPSNDDSTVSDSDQDHRGMIQ